MTRQSTGWWRAAQDPVTPSFLKLDNMKKRITQEPEFVISNKPYASDIEQLAALRAPFPDSAYMTNDKNGGRTQFLGFDTIQNRLLDVFGPGLSISTTHIIERDGFVSMEVSIEVEWVSGRKSKMAGWGFAAVQPGKQSFRWAHSDAIRSAAMQMGCGN